MGLLFLLSSIPYTGEPGHLPILVPSTIQNLLHIPAFGLLALLWIVTLKDCGVAKLRSTVVALVLASGYAAIIELFQAWVPGRVPSVGDFFFDVAGIVLVILLYWQAKPLNPRNAIERLFRAQRSDH